MILVLAPLKAECAALSPHLTKLLGPARPAFIEGRVRADQYPGLMLAAAGHGKVQFALTAGLALASLKPRLLVCVGAAGALDPGLDLGEVVIAQQTVEHDFNLKSIERPLPAFAGDTEALRLLRAKHPGVRTLTMASGDEDVVDAARAESLRRTTGAAAVAWEGAGAARAARFYRVPFVELRAITDRAGVNAMTEFRRHLDSALMNLSPLLATLRDFAPAHVDIDRPTI